MNARHSLNGALAGIAAAAVWAAQQPLDKRLFGSRYDDVELLGKLVTRRPAWIYVGLVMHLTNGALFGAAYARLGRLLPGPAAIRGLTAAQIENFGSWPAVRFTDRLHPARRELPVLAGNRRALALATWRHALFGAVLGALEARLSR